MKKLIFTLMMMAVLAFVATTAMAANEDAVYGGGTYTYNLDQIKTSAAGGNINIIYEGNTEAITMTSATESGSGPNWEIDASAGGYTATFTIEFSEVAAEAANNLVVTITDLDATKACSNFINYEITVYPLPEYTLALAASISETCQVGFGDAANTDNNPEYLGTDIEDEEVSFTVTVTPAITGIIGGTEYTYDYTLSIDDFTATLNSYGITSSDVTISDLATLDGGENYSETTSADPTTLTGDVFTVTFNTTTGIAAQEIVAALDMASGNAVLSTTVGGISEDATSGGTTSATVTVGAVPSIGGFN